MSKRKYSELEETAGPKIPIQNKAINKNSLDSDEEDEDDESDRYALKDEDIEGQEEGNVGLEEGVQFTPFNMNEELEEGHFDANGMYHWKKEKLIRDNWLENIDWIKVKQSEVTDSKTSEDLEEMPEAVDIMQLYKKILNYLKPKESITHALKRLGGNKSLSASERLKLKKAGKLPTENIGHPEKVTELTELANKILTEIGNMDIYQETYELISEKIAASTSKVEEPVLDMYADDFGDKEKERLSEVPSENKPNTIPSENKVIMWEYKEKEGSKEINGPYSTEQMAKWSGTGKFKSGVLVRKCGTEQFYTSNRIDFELYL